ncbi:MAG: hypothetical protein B7Y83_09370 [Flavobacteriales bacterium 32-34-25]|nr:MAG: hypothetical protein B7Y83_09370 [Flavobacteriales bacterium 32-34-25]
MVNKLKASIELTLLVFIMALFIVGIGIYGILEIRQLNNSSKELYNDRMLPMDQLADIRFYTSSIIVTGHQIDNRQISYSEALQKLTQAQDSIKDNWKNYRLTYLTEKEKKLVSEMTIKINQTNNTIEKLKLILKKEDSRLLHSILKNELYSGLNSIIIYTSNLLHLQVEIGNKINIKSNEVYSSYTQKFLWILLLIFVFAIPFTYYLIKKIGTIISSLNLNNAKLFLAEKKYRNLIEYAGEAILILNEETEIIDLNDAASILLGYTREELLNMRISNLVSPEDIEKQNEDINWVRKNKFAIINRKVKKKDGTFIETEISNRLMDGKGFFAIIHDITARKNAEEAIKKSEEKYRYLFDNNPAYIIVWDIETLEVLEINNAVLDNYGYTEEEWASMSVLDYRPQEDCNDIKDFAQYMLNNDESISKRSWRHCKKNGEEMIMDIASHKINYNNRKAVLSLAKDITAQAKAEAQLIEREAQLDLFIEHSPASLAMFDANMCYLSTSRRWMTDYNLLGQDIIGKSHYEIFPEIGQEWKDIHQRCLQGVIEKREEDSFLRTDGSIDWLKWEIRPWYKSSNELGGVIMFTEVITERKKATELFKKQFENSPDIILYVNQFYKIEAINRVHPNVGTMDDVIGLDCIEILPEESRKDAKEAIVKCFATKESQEIENALNHGRWVRSRIVPIAVNDEVTHVMIFATDLSERKQAELKLKQSEEKHRVLTENISDAILLLDENAKIIYQSPSAEKISGYSFEDARNKCFTEFLASEEIIRGQLFVEEVMKAANVPKQNQFRLIHKNGQEIWVEGTALNLLEKDSVNAIIVNYRDISKRKELEAQQALTASIVNSSDDAIISKTLDNIITSWNKGAEKILGYSAEEMIGNTVLKLIPENLRGEEKEISAQIAVGQAIEHFETVRQKKNGELIYVSLTISPIYDKLGNVVGASKIMRDITESKTFENELIRYNAELKKTNAELDRFVYSASHDLRAPLKSMLGLIYITTEDVKENETLDNGLEIIERLDLLNKSVVKLDSFIEDILDYSRNARLELVYEEIDFENLVHEVKNQLKFTDEKQKIDFSISINSKQLFVSDCQRLKVVLNNIISNAYKYSDIEKERSFIKVTFFTDSTKATIVIEDNGIGIVESDQEKIFDMFYRATITSTGSGLGLYIVKETMEKLGGKISVESEYGKNSKFYIEIPNKINLLN